MIENNKKDYDYNYVFLFGAGLSYGIVKTQEEIKEKIEKKLKEVLGECKYSNSELKLKEDESLEKYLNRINNLEKSKEKEEIQEIQEIVCKELKKGKNIKEKISKEIEKSEAFENFKKAFENLKEYLDESDNRIIDVFTLNYDTLVEEVLIETKIHLNSKGYKKENNIYSFDISNFDYRKCIKTPKGFEPIPAINLYKLHGDLNFKKKENGEETEFEKISNESFKNIKYDDMKKMIVLPTKNKYEQTSLEYRYFELLRAFKDKIMQKNTKVFIYGYSFGDKHVNSILKTAATSPNNLFVVNCYTKDDKTKAEKILGKHKKIKFLNLEVKDFFENKVEVNEGSDINESKK